MLSGHSYGFSLRVGDSFAIRVLTLHFPLGSVRKDVYFVSHGLFFVRF
jgi:hypothetical protein